MADFTPTDPPGAGPRGAGGAPPPGLKARASFRLKEGGAVAPLTAVPSPAQHAADGKAGAPESPSESAVQDPPGRGGGELRRRVAALGDRPWVANVSVALIALGVLLLLLALIRVL